MAELDFNDVVKTAVNSAVQNTITPIILKTVDDLVLDPDWLIQVEQRAQQQVSQKLVGRISNIDLQTMIRDQIDAALESWRYKLVENFNSAGITDRASRTQMVIMDEAVVINTALSSVSANVEMDAEVGGCLRVKDLAVRGDINLDNRAWQKLEDAVAERVNNHIDQTWRETLISQVLALAKTQGIDFDSVTVGGQQLVKDATLGSHITHSNLATVGVLEKLTVSGESSLSGVMQISSKRVGINTKDPEMALSIWDEEVNLLLGKHSKDGAFLGTGRRQTLSIGINRRPSIRINEDGQVSFDQNITVDRFCLGFTDHTPGHSGTRGDILFNSDPKPGQPFAWTCLGGYKWKSLKVVEQ
jgi:hypothetical protein